MFSNPLKDQGQLQKFCTFIVAKSSVPMNVGILTCGKPGWALESEGEACHGGREVPHVRDELPTHAGEMLSWTQTVKEIDWSQVSCLEIVFTIG